LALVGQVVADEEGEQDEVRLEKASLDLEESPAESGSDAWNPKVDHLHRTPLTCVQPCADEVVPELLERHAAGVGGEGIPKCQDGVDAGRLGGCVLRSTKAVRVQLVAEPFTKRLQMEGRDLEQGLQGVEAVVRHRVAGGVEDSLEKLAARSQQSQS